MIRDILLFLLRNCPLKILALKTCNQGISKIIIASSFTLGHLINDNEKITCWKIKKNVFFFCFCFFVFFFGGGGGGIKTCNQDISKRLQAVVSN